MYHDSAGSKNSNYLIPFKPFGRFQFERCVYQNFWGATKTRDRMGLAGTRSRVLAFGTFGSRVPGFYVIANTDICFLPLAINDSDTMYIDPVHKLDILT